jgi:Tol biopolymer transport system component
MTLNITNIKRIGLSADFGPNDYEGISPSFSPDGTKVLFTSQADNLIPGGTTPGVQHVYIDDLTTDTITLVSANQAGDEADRPSAAGATFSPDGGKVLFSTYSDNLVAGDGNYDWDVFVKDLSTGAVTLVSTNSTGDQGDESSIEPSFSPDGGKVAFVSDSFNFPGTDAGDGATTPEIELKDLATGTLILVSSGSGGTPGDAISHFPVFSPDGSMIAFQGSSAGLVAGDTNDASDIFVKNLATGVLTRVSTGTSGQQLATQSFRPVWSPDGTKIAFQSGPSDGSAPAEIYIKDLITGKLTKVSTSGSGTPGNHDSSRPVWSPDGTRILFSSFANNLIHGDSNGAEDVFVKDLVTGQVSRIDLAPGGTQANGDSMAAAFSPDGTQVVFTSHADNLVAGDPGSQQDIFVVTLNDDGVVTGTIGADNLKGRDTAETFSAYDGDDIVRGNGGDDIVSGGAGNDALYGGLGLDTLLGNDGNDELHGGNDADTLRGADGDDTLYGDNGDDFLSGGIGNDALYGGFGADKLTGGDGSDALEGGNGQDELRGNDGGDILNGGAHIDYLTGGTGADTFIFDSTAFIGGEDRIKDFNVSEGDKIDLKGILIGYQEGVSNLSDFVFFARKTSGGGGFDFHPGTIFMWVDSDGKGGAYLSHILAWVQNTNTLDANTLHAGGSLVVS